MNVKVLIASDKYKGSLTAKEVCEIIESQLPSTNEVSCLPLADGGDGSLSIIREHLKGNTYWTVALDPLGRPIIGEYFISEETVYIELADASGIARLSPNEYDVMKTTSISTGKIISMALKPGIKEVVLFLGGSCTHDLGFGILNGLGYKFINNQNEEIIPSAGTLSDIADVIIPHIENPVHIRLIADVTNTICGPDGAHIYTPQKGASPEEQRWIETETNRLVLLLEKKTKKTLFDIVGGGATGGIPIGILALWPIATLERGFSFMNSVLHIEERIATSDLIITGEGRLDSTSLSGKVVGSMVELCDKYSKPCVIIVGSCSDAIREKIKPPIYALTDIAPVDICLEQPEKTLKKLLKDVVWSNHITR